MYTSFQSNALNFDYLVSNQSYNKVNRRVGGYLIFAEFKHDFF